MFLGLVDTDRDRRLRELAVRALEGLEPVAVVTRRTDNSLAIAGRPSNQPLPTIHDDPADGLEKFARKLLRVLGERINDTYGHGPDAGRTVYGTTRFVAVADAARGASAVASALARQGDVGTRTYGAVALVVDPARVRGARTTYAAGDSGANILVRVRGRDELARVVAERLEKRYHAARMPDPDALRRMPTAAAVDAIRGWLLSDSLATPYGYIELQVRSLALDDVAATVIDVRTPDPDERRRTIDPGPTPTLHQVAALEDAFRRRGVDEVCVER